MVVGGVVKNNKTAKHTYMKMGEVGIGLGLEVKDFRVIFVFLYILNIFSYNFHFFSQFSYPLAHSIILLFIDIIVFLNSLTVMAYHLLYVICVRSGWIR